jgi:hypothetical protein
MKRASALRQLGTTQQKLLRALLVAPQGASVERLATVSASPTMRSGNT